MVLFKLNLLFISMNSAEPQTSNTVQGEQVGNIAVQCRNNGVYDQGPGIDDYSTFNLHNVAQMSIVLDDSVTSHASIEPLVSPAGSSDRSMSQATNLYHCSIRDQDPAGAVAVAEMQVRRALLGAKLIRSSAKLSTNNKTETGPGL